MTDQSFEVSPVGYVRNEGDRTYLDILQAYVPALQQLQHFSHVNVLWWISGFQGDESRAVLQGQPPYEAPVSGVFALRSPRRPNPIGLTVARVLDVDHKHGVVEIGRIDAFHGTPLLDLKAYIPVEERVRDARVPEWMAGWPEWLPEERRGSAEEQRAPVTSETDTFELVPVGTVRCGAGGAALHIAQAYVPALKNLEHFGHVRIFWWAHRLESDPFRRATHNTPPYENAPVTGVFASRSSVRPNPIGLSTARILGVDHETGIVAFKGMNAFTGANAFAATEAFDGTPLLDLKPYLPSGDRVQTCAVPEWMASWPAWAT